MIDVFAKGRSEVALSEDEQPVENLGPCRLDPALGDGVCSWRSDRGLDDPDPLRAEDLVEGGGELRVSVVDEEAKIAARVGERHREVSRLLGDPDVVGTGGATGEMNPTTRELDQKEHVDRLSECAVDGEEVACHDAR